MLCDVTHHVISHIVSYRAVSYPIRSYPIVSFHITSYLATSPDILSYVVISDHDEQTEESQMLIPHHDHVIIRIMSCYARPMRSEVSYASWSYHALQYLIEHSVWRPTHIFWSVVSYRITTQHTTS